MSKRDEHDLAGALIAKAAGDEAGLRALAENYDVPDHVVGRSQVRILSGTFLRNFRICRGSSLKGAASAGDVTVGVTRVCRS